MQTNRSLTIVTIFFFQLERAHATNIGEDRSRTTKPPSLVEEE